MGKKIFILLAAVAAVAVVFLFIGRTQHNNVDYMDKEEVKNESEEKVAENGPASDSGKDTGQIGLQLEKIKEKAIQKVKEEIKNQIAPDKVFGTDCINLVFFGLDKNQERVSTLGCFRTDTIVVMRLDFVNNSVFMFSIPRDTYVYIPCKNRYDKINHAFPFGGGAGGGGFQASIETIENFLGIKIDHYFGMDMEAIAPVVDAIGGVEYEVDVEYHKKGYNLSKGLQVLNGKTAEQYVRFRYTENGDIDRVKRQQKFLLAFLEEAKKKVDIKKALKIYGIVKDMTYTDMNEGQLVSLGYFFYKLERKSFAGYVVEGSFMNKNGISYWRPDIEKVKAKVKEVFAK